MRFTMWTAFLALTVASLVAGARAADEAGAKFDPQLYQQVVRRAVDYLTKKGQADDGSYSAKVSPAVTALCVSALLRNGLSPDDPGVAKSLKYLEGFVQKDGGIYKPDSSIQNYETSISLMCFVDANKDGRYKKLIDGANNYIKNIQWGADGKVGETDLKYGGAGYGKSGSRPDLSNTAFLVEALHDVGDETNHEALQRALAFVSRCQNLDSKYNTTPFAAKNPDGGFYYTPADNGQSAPGGKTDDGGLRSYGSMTYAGLKSMIFAGLTPEDERVKAAIGWIAKNYDLKSNPGMGQSGLYYSYNAFAKALNALGKDTFEDAKGVKHDWRGELLAQLAKRQNEDGSWTNADKRFMEGDANLVTSYCLLVLSNCQPKTP